MGFTVDDSFLVGYGLEYRGRYGNLPDLRAVDRRALESDPDAYVDPLYRTRTPRPQSLSP